MYQNEKTKSEQIIMNGYLLLHVKLNKITIIKLNYADMLLQYSMCVQNNAMLT